MTKVAVLCRLVDLGSRQFDDLAPFVEFCHDIEIKFGRWEAGQQVAVFRGGHNAVTGQQSVITVRADPNLSHRAD